jgi:hypothetical protein
MMDTVHNCDSCIIIPLSQINRSYNDFDFVKQPVI